MTISLRPERLFFSYSLTLMCLTRFPWVFIIIEILQLPKGSWPQSTTSRISKEQDNIPHMSQLKIRPDKEHCHQFFFESWAGAVLFLFSLLVWDLGVWLAEGNRKVICPMKKHPEKTNYSTY